MKKSIIFAAFVLVIAIPAAHARVHHGNDGVYLASQIVGLIGNVLAPPPVMIAQTQVVAVQPAPVVVVPQQPVIVQPAPVVVHPPVIVQPTPVVVVPQQPVIVQPAPIVVHPPVIVRPRPIVVAPPPKPVVVHHQRIRPGTAVQVLPATDTQYRQYDPQRRGYYTQSERQNFNGGPMRPNVPPPIGRGVAPRNGRF